VPLACFPMEMTRCIVIGLEHVHLLLLNFPVNEPPFDACKHDMCEQRILEREAHTPCKKTRSR
jgi:hypothetical protein